MSILYTSSKLILSALILFNLSCSHASQNNQIDKTQNVEFTKVEPLPPPENQNVDVTSESSNILTIAADLPLLPPPRKLTAQEEKELNREIQKAWKDEDERIEKIVFQNRDVAQYEKDDSYCYTLRCRQKKVNFIWEHLKNKKRAFAKDFSQGIDVSYTNYIFAEPAENGEWQIVFQTIRRVVVEEPDISEDVFGANSVELVKSKSRKGEWKLIFKNKDREIVKEF